MLVSAFRSRGIECDLLFNQLDENKINIILGYHLLNFDEGLKRYRYIPYQLEQLHSEGYPFNENLENILRHAYDVWDYSEKNIGFLAGKGINARLLVPGYHENLEVIPKVPNKSIDILFYGSIGERRKKILDELTARFNVKLLFGVYGKKRDDWISRSKIILNFHHYSQKIFEAVRVSYLLNNGCFVVSETATEYPYSQVTLPMVPYENLVETCADFLESPGKMEHIKQQNYIQFKTHYRIADLIKPLIS